MPHCIIEYSRPIESQVSVDKLVSMVFDCAIKSELFSVEDTKVRAIAFDYQQTGLKGKECIHIEMKIFAGRTIEQKQALSQLVFDSLAALALENTTISVEVNDIDVSCYLKNH